MFKVVIVFVILGVAACRPRADSPPIYGPPAPSYQSPHQQLTYEDESKKPYAFDYGVKDDYTGASFGHQENADSHGSVTGSYQVALPDGRIQTVNYVADHEKGFIADVQYEGNAVYPEVKPYQPPSAPSYQPAPTVYASPAPNPYV